MEVKSLELRKVEALELMANKLDSLEANVVDIRDFSDEIASALGNITKKLEELRREL